MSKLFPHPGMQLLFALLSGADLGLTCWLLGHSGGSVYEANPVAGWCLARHGWGGLAGFKGAVVLVVLGLTALIFRRRPRAAGRLLGFGCAGLALVVLYSAALCRTARTTARTSAQINQEYEHTINREARREFRLHLDFQAVMRGACEDLLAGRSTLREAQGRVAATDRAKDPRWLRALAVHHPGRSPGELIAACIIQYAVTEQAGKPRAAWRLALRLEREFEHSYGSPCPLHHRASLRGTGPEGGEAGAGAY
jgi:hypothetical protein